MRAREDCVSLPGKPQLRLQKGNLGETGGGVPHILRCGIRHQNFIRTSGLFTQVTECVGQDCRTSARRNADHGSEREHAPSLLAESVVMFFSRAHPVL